MFHVPTVFVIGAGAGVDVDMPTGKSLTDEIAKKVAIRFEGGTKKVSGDDITYEELKRVARTKGISVNDLTAAGRKISVGIHYTRSIDSYVHTHNNDENIKICAKIAIVQTILEHERRSKLFVDETKHPVRFNDVAGVRGSWMQEFMYLIQDGIVASNNIAQLFNNLTIVNFNYDRCLEQFLYRAIQELYVVDGQVTAELISTLNLFHPYGWIGPLSWQGGGFPFGADPFTQGVTLASLSKNICTFNEEVEEGTTLEKLRRALSLAERIVFLGFHFHFQNLKLIEDETFNGKKTTKRVYATAFERSIADIQLIQNRVGLLLRESSLDVIGRIEDMDCKSLFREFGTTLAS
jgi:hypothetical protein